MKKSGDTLIEVLFAFAIIGVVIGVAFSGAMSSYRAAVSAQNRTQATFAVKYQAEALETYRKAISFESLKSTIPTNQNSLGFCMRDIEGSWRVQPKTNQTSTDQNNNTVEIPDDCDSLAKVLAPGLNQPELTIKATATNDRSITANIVLEWTGNNSNQRESVRSTVVLTKGVE